MVSTVQKFFLLNYEKSKLVFAVHANLAKIMTGQIIDTLESFDRSSTMNSKVKKTPVARDWLVPKLEEDYVVFTSTGNEPVIRLLYWIPLEVSERGLFNYLFSVINNIASEILINKFNLAHSISFHSTFFEGSAQMVIKAEITKRGKQKQSLVVYQMQKILAKLVRTESISIFLGFSADIKAQSIIRNLSTSDQSLAATLSENYYFYGQDSIWTGHTNFGSFKRETIFKLLMELSSTRNIVVVDGEFEKDEEYQNDYLTYFKLDIMKDDHFGLDKSSNSMIKLVNRTSPLGNWYSRFSIKGFSFNKLLKHYNSHSKADQNVVDIYQNIIPSQAFLSDISSFMPSGLLENRTHLLMESCSDCSYFLNEKYKLPMSTIHFVINFDCPTDQSSYIWMKYYTEILNKRSKEITIHMSKFMNTFRFEASESGIIARISLLSEAPADLLMDVLSRIFSLTISSDDDAYAMQKLYETHQNKHLQPGELAIDLALRLFLEFLPSPKQQMAFVRKQAMLLNQSLKLPVLFVSNIHIEQPSTGLAPLQVHKVLQFLQRGQPGFFNSKIKIPPINNILLAREGLLEEEGPQAIIGYSTCNYLGTNSPDRFANMHVLYHLMDGYAQQYLQMRGAQLKSLKVRKLQKKGGLFLCLEVDSNLKLVEVEAEVERIIERLDELLPDLTDEVFYIALRKAKDELFPTFNNIMDESYERYKKILQGQTQEHDEQVRQLLTVLDSGQLYEAYFLAYIQSARRVIAEVVSPSHLHDQPISDNLIFNRLGTLKLLIMDEMEIPKK